MEWADYWKPVNIARRPDGSKKYHNLMKFVGVIATLPSSNAGVERIFSSLRLIKTERRGSMKVATLVSLMQIRFKIKSSSSASNIKIDKTLSSLVNQMSTNATHAEAMDASKKYLSNC